MWPAEEILNGKLHFFCDTFVEGVHIQRSYSLIDPFSNISNTAKPFRFKFFSSNFTISCIPPKYGFYAPFEELPELSWHLLISRQQKRNTRTICAFKVNYKDTKRIGVILVFSLLTLNRFHAVFWFFHWCFTL